VARERAPAVLFLLSPMAWQAACEHLSRTLDYPRARYQPRSYQIIRLHRERNTTSIFDTATQRYLHHGRLCERHRQRLHELLARLGEYSPSYLRPSLFVSSEYVVLAATGIPESRYVTFDLWPGIAASTVRPTSLLHFTSTHPQTSILPYHCLKELHDLLGHHVHQNACGFECQCQPTSYRRGSHHCLLCLAVFASSSHRDIEVHGQKANVLSSSYHPAATNTSAKSTKTTLRTDSI
jgi:hypothetical protein